MSNFDRCINCQRQVDDLLTLRRAELPERSFRDWGTICDECGIIQQGEQHHVHNCGFCAGPRWKPFAERPMEVEGWGLCGDCYEAVFTIREPHP